MRFVPLGDDIYEKVEKVAKSVGVSVQDVVTGLIRRYLDGYAKELEEMKRKIEPFRKLMEVFCNGGRAIRIKGTPIVVCKGGLFLKVKDLRRDVRKVIEEYDAKVVEECNEEGGVVGYFIVPKVGFNGETMEGWFINKGIPLLKKLAKVKF